MRTEGEREQDDPRPDETLMAVLTKVEFDLSHGEQLVQTSTTLLERHLIPVADDLKKHIHGWMTRDDDYSKFIRGVECLKAARASNETITVAELAGGLNVSRGTADKLLANGQVPGARRKTPGQKNSPWLIPADAVASLRSAA